MRSIRSQLTLSHIGMAALVIALMFLLSGGMLRSYLLDEARDSLVSRGENMGRLMSMEMVARGPRMRHDDNFQAWMHITGAAADVDFIVLSASGEPLAYSLRPEILEDPVALGDATPALRALETGESQSVDWTGRDGDPMVAVFVPVVSRVDGNILGVVALFQPVRAVTEAADELRNVVLQTSALALLLAVLAGLFLARRISRPAEELSDLARALGRGDLEARSHGDYAGEFAQLAQQMDEMAEQLGELLRSRTLFAALISHEIRTPITTVRGFTQAILDGVIDPADQGPYLKSVLDETRRIERLLGDLLQLERLESGQLPLEPDWLPVSRLLEDASSRILPAVLEKNLEIDTREPSAEVEVWADEERIAQVLGNLLDNAVRHSPESGEIRISAEVSGRAIGFSVEDEGIGFSAEDLERVFDRFYRASNAGGGVGLGLAISREIVERHGGYIEAGESSLGGARVTFTLPRIRTGPSRPIG